MRKTQNKKNKKINLDLSKKKITKEPLNIFKKINLDKFKKITSFSLNKTIEKFKETRKKDELNKIKLQKIEEIKELKQKKNRRKKYKTRRRKKNKDSSFAKIKR